MKLEPNLDALGIPSPPPQSWRVYASLIAETAKHIHRRFGAPERITDQEADSIIYLAFLHLPLDDWKYKFSRAAHSAIKFYRNPDTVWKTIDHALRNPKIDQAYKNLNPAFDPNPPHVRPMPTPAPHKITPQVTPTPKKKHPPKRGQLWKLDRRWDHLWPSSRKTFTELCRRTQKPKKPFAFTWCQAGIPSLVKFTGVSDRQVKRALQQLQNHSLIKRIVRGYEGSRGSKYYVFLTPKMSGAFYFTTRQAKNQQPQKKRASRIH